MAMFPQWAKSQHIDARELTGTKYHQLTSQLEEGEVLLGVIESQKSLIIPEEWLELLGFLGVLPIHAYPFVLRDELSFRIFKAGVALVFGDNVEISFYATPDTEIDEIEESAEHPRLS